MRILLADDHQMMRDGLRAILEKHAHEVVGEVGNGHDAVAMAEATRPDLVVMDVSMPGLNGVDATKRLLQSLPGIAVLGLSMHTDARYAQAMLGAGAVGYVVKSAASEELVQAVRAIAEGQRFVSSFVSGLPKDFLEQNEAVMRVPPERRLTAREREVLQLLAEGSSSKEIARRLRIAVATVETHRRQISAKLDLRTIAELTKYAIREGITFVES
jgi:DNA-binding NarL/FixJ family response regulator